MISRKKAVLATLLLSGTVLAACGSSSSTSSTATSAASASTTTTAAPAPLTNITIALPVAEPVQSPVYLAQQEGYFKKQGLNVKIVVLAGDVIVNSALVSNSVQFTSVNSVSLLTAVSKGIPLQMACMEYNGPEWAMAVTNQIASSDKLTSSSTPQQVLGALKGDKVAVVGGASAAPGIMLTGLLQHFGMPKNALTIFAVSSSAALVTALQHNEVQAIFDTQPIPASAEQVGAGKVVFDTTEISELAAVPWEGILGAKSYMASNPTIVKGVCNAISEADNYLITNPSGATTALQPTFPKLSPSLLQSALTSYKWVKDAQMTDSQWTNGLAALESFHLLSKPVSSAVLSSAYSLNYLPPAS
ncbi:MAG: ABC transporter substrate-binding protein [Candidatus Marsarchaeota archaeon]|nr:ABC transporter substrate-binding protein [Candidatus Marsarchaeota archaeon]MDA8081015.1 ABC transporter substrate-binding protein [Actinomycetota bacterium]